MTSPRPAPLLVVGGLVGALVLALGGCAATAPASEAPGDPAAAAASVDIADLLGVQEQALARFDEAHAAPDRCGHLCEHLDAICVIGDRVCALAARYPAPAHDAACERAMARCAATAARLPPECPCAGAPEALPTDGAGQGEGEGAP